jgi:hypothetical protein
MSEASDRDEIRQLIATYTIEGDRGRVDALAQAFAENATMAIPTWRAVGRAGIRQALGGGGSATTQGQGTQTGAAPGRGRIVRHHLTSSLITFNGPDEASGRTYWINFSEKGPDHSGLYADTYRRLGGRWFIVHREVRLDWKAPDSRLGPTMLVGPRPADAPPLPVFTGD